MNSHFRSHFVPPVVRLMLERGVDAAPLLRSHAMDANAGEKRYVDLPLPSLHAFLDEVAELLGEDVLGPIVAARVSRESWDGLRLRCLAAATLRDGLYRMVRLIRMFNSQVEIVVREDGGDLVFEHRIPGHPRALSRHGNETILPFVLATSAEASGESLEPIECWFAHERTSTPPALVEALGTRRIHFGTGLNGFRLHGEDGARSLRSADPILRVTVHGLATRSVGARGV